MLTIRKVISRFIVVVALPCIFVPIQYLLAAECETIEGEIQLWQGWPPWVRIESKGKRSMYGIETNVEVTKSDFMPQALLKKLNGKPFLAGTFCVKLTGGKTSVPYDDRIISYVKIVSYKLEVKRPE